ncbi:hypothetical protein [Marinobacterium lutimaris]|nr:hypothetical protein [Marinobacterium lutimaris]
MKTQQILDFLLEVIRIFKPDQRKWIVRIFIVSGIGMISTPFWQPWIEAILEKEVGLNLSYTAIPGWILIVLGLLIYIFNEWQSRQSAKAPTFNQEHKSLNFSLGNGMTCGYSIEQLRKQPNEPFHFGSHVPIKVYVDKNKLYGDVEIFAESGMPPIKISKNSISGLPHDWDVNKNEKALEVVDSNSNPVYQLIYKSDGHIILNGIFPFPGGLVVADETGMTMNPTLPYTMQLNRIFKYPAWKYPAEYQT